jgi:hypothetical protein
VRRALTLTAASVAVQAAGLLSFWALWLAAFGGARRVPAALDVPLAYALLLGTGLSAGAAACAGLYLLVRRAPWWVALPAGGVCLGSLTLAALWVYSVAVFRSWV